jgi:hypothetical protein
MWRVRVALALAPSGGGIEARADFDALTDPDAVRLMLGVGSAVVVMAGESDAAGLTDWGNVGRGVAVVVAVELPDTDGAGLVEDDGVWAVDWLASAEAVVVRVGVVVGVTTSVG